MQLGEVIKKNRLQKHFTQVDFAKAVGITQTYLSQIEKSKKRALPKTYKKIAECLNIPLSALLFQCLEESDFVTNEDKVHFAMAKPIIDKIIFLL